MSQRPELFKGVFRRFDYYLIIDNINSVHDCLFILLHWGVLHTIYFFFLVFNKHFTYHFVEDVNSWMRGNHEFHEN